MKTQRFVKGGKAQNNLLFYISQMKSYVSPWSECILVMYFLYFHFILQRNAITKVSLQEIHTYDIVLL